MDEELLNPFANTRSMPTQQPAPMLSAFTESQSSGKVDADENYYNLLLGLDF